MTTVEPTTKQDVNRNFSTASESRKGSKFKLELENSDVKKPPVADIFLKTDLDGLAEFYEASSKWLKIVWLVIIVITTLFLCSELYACVRDFRDNPILTTYSFVADNIGMKFPEIYICPSVPVHRETWKEMNVDKNWEKHHVTGIFGAHINSSELGTVLGLKTTGLESLSYRTAFEAGLCYDPKAGCWTPKDIQEYFLKVGYPVESFLKECSFNGQANCSDPIEIFDPSRGKCFLFKQPEGSRQTVAGVGLSLVLDLDIDNAYPTNDADYWYCKNVDAICPLISNSYKIIPNIALSKNYRTVPTQSCMITENLLKLAQSIAVCLARSGSSKLTCPVKLFRRLQAWKKLMRNRQATHSSRLRKIRFRVRITPPPAPARAGRGRTRSSDRRDAFVSTTESPTYEKATKGPSGFNFDRRRKNRITTPPAAREAANKNTQARVD